VGFFYDVGYRLFDHFAGNRLRELHLFFAYLAHNALLFYFCHSRPFHKKVIMCLEGALNRCNARLENQAAQFYEWFSAHSFFGVTAEI
jgi:hypothetical protein